MLLYNKAMPNCTKCQRKMRSDRQSEFCKPCSQVCGCGKPKDFRAKQCLSCGMRTKALRQWQERGEVMREATTSANRKRWKGYVKPTRLCAIDGCDKKQSAKRLCSNHYQKLKRYGDPLRQPPTTEERFWSRIEKTDSCWLWTGLVNDAGYGMIGVDKKLVRAHRYSYWLHYGEWPLPVGRHTCDNPKCVRPDHIVAGTHQDNMADRCKRKRHAFGERVGTARLTSEQVREIKQLLKSGARQSDVADAFAISASHVSRINTGSQWKEIE